MAAAPFGLVAETASVTVVSLPTVVLAGVAVIELITGGFGAGGPTTTGTPVAPTASAPGHKVEWKPGSGIGIAQGAGSSCPTTLVPEPGPFIGPEPQNRKGKSWKLFETRGMPKLRFSGKTNSKTGRVYWPGIRPFACGVVEACEAIRAGVARGSIWQIVCNCGVSTAFT